MNNVPHLGNLIGAVLSADVFARFHRSLGSEVLYICGSDEHGTTTEIKAMEEGLSPQELCDKYYQIHKDIYDWFNISFDIFGRTSDKTQTELTHKIFMDLYNNGFIVEDKLEQTFDEKEQKFLADRFVEGTCPYCGAEGARGDQCDACGRMLNPKELIDPISKLSGTKPVIKKVKHLFLDLEKLQPELERWVDSQSKKGDWSPNAVQITTAWFKEGLSKRCITRDLKWGVKVPLKGWENKVFYVWFDAPIGYISITKQLLGDRYVDWWQKPDEVDLYQFMGKDNIPFHTILFPASLIGTKKPWTMLHHMSSTEYLQYEGGKFSKSKQLGVFGDDAKNTGILADVFRYYLLTNRPENSDTTFSWDDFAEKLNNELVANLGNLINRTMMFINRFADGNIIDNPAFLESDESFWKEVEEKEDQLTTLLSKTKLKEGIKLIMEISKMGNAYFQASEPWKVIKEDKTRAKTSLFVLAHLCKDLAIMLKPYLPTSADSIFKQLNTKELNWNDLGRFSLSGKKIGTPNHLFEKIDESKIKELKERFSGQRNKQVSTKESDEKVFSRFDLRVAKIISVEKHPSADKLFIEKIDVGDLGERQIVSGLVGHYSPDELLGKNIVIVANLKPAKLRGKLSQGMLLASEDENRNVGLVLAPDAVPGTKVLCSNITTNPSKELTIDEFFSIRLESSERGVFLGENELLADKKSLTIDKDSFGIIC